MSPPAIAQWTISGPTGFEGNNQTYIGDKFFHDAPSGNYFWAGQDNITEKNPPSAYVQALAVGGTILFNKVWTPLEILTIDLPNSVPLVLVKIPGGTFQMGSPDTEQDRYKKEGPIHEVTISKDFYIGKYELTKRQWQAVMSTAPWEGRSNVLNDLYSPAVYVSWRSAQVFITALNAHIKSSDQGPLMVRLPTEAEWEYACRAGTTSRFYWGNDLTYYLVEYCLTGRYSVIYSSCREMISSREVPC